MLVSRVRKLEHITFVGDKEETLSSIRTLLQKKNQWGAYCEAIINSAANCSSATVPLAAISPFRPAKIEVPNGDVRFVYQLISLKDNGVTFVRQTKNLRRTLFQHNSKSQSLHNYYHKNNLL